MKKVVLSGCVNWGRCSCTEASLSILWKYQSHPLVPRGSVNSCTLLLSPRVSDLCHRQFDRKEPQERQNKVMENNEEAQKSMGDGGAFGHRQRYSQLYPSPDTASVTVPAPNSTGPISVCMQLIEMIFTEFI